MASKAAPKSKAVSTARVSFESEVYRAKDIPTKLKTEKGRAAEGVWGMQELQINGEDFVVAFGRTWEGAADPRTSGMPVVKKAAAKNVVAKKASAKRDPSK